MVCTPTLQIELQNLWEHIERRERAILLHVHNDQIERDKRYDAKFATVKVSAELAAEAVRLAMNAAEKAVEKAEAATNKRFESVNEFRAQMADMQATFARMDMVESRFVTLSSKVSASAREDVMESRFNAVQRRLDDFATWQNTMVGRSSGIQAGWAWIVGGITVVATVASTAAVLFFNH
jgi:hypothetical protein